jgi:hypothetical protein
LLTICFVPFLSFSIHAEEIPEAHPIAVLSQDDLVFGVRSIQLNAADQTGQPDNLAVHFFLQNGNDTKKVDLLDGLTFELEDEFNNHYRQIPPNAAGLNAMFQVKYPKKFPSLYPQEIYEEVVFFEPPVQSSQELNFIVKVQSIGLLNDIHLRLPLRNAQPRQETLIQKPKQQDVAIHIVYPDKRVVLTPGETIHISVRSMPRDRQPESIYVISPFYVLHDTDVVYGYDVTIPKDYKETSLTIVVVGKWPGAEDEQDMSSDSVTFDVMPDKNAG